MFLAAASLADYCGRVAPFALAGISATDIANAMLAYTCSAVHLHSSSVAICH
jgi:hypothetical protein